MIREKGIIYSCLLKTALGRLNPFTKYFRHRLEQWKPHKKQYQKIDGQQESGIVYFAKVGRTSFIKLSDDNEQNTRDNYNSSNNNNSIDKFFPSAFLWRCACFRWHYGHMLCSTAIFCVFCQVLNSFRYCHICRTYTFSIVSDFIYIALSSSSSSWSYHNHRHETHTTFTLNAVHWDTLIQFIRNLCLSIALFCRVVCVLFSHRKKLFFFRSVQDGFATCTFLHFILLFSLWCCCCCCHFYFHCRW